MIGVIDAETVLATQSWHKLAGNVIKKDKQDELLGKFFYFPVARATRTICIQYKKTKDPKKKKPKKKKKKRKNGLTDFQAV
jgi:hypothetical protein